MIVFIISVLVAALCWTAADRLKESVKKDQNWIDFLNSMSVDELDKYLKK